jgi:hypothetical protein
VTCATNPERDASSDSPKPEAFFKVVTVDRRETDRRSAAAGPSSSGTTSECEAGTEGIVARIREVMVHRGQRVVMRMAGWKDQLGRVLGLSSTGRLDSASGEAADR